jgi:geranylgeranyl transferase type-2 subunit beta
MDPESYLPRLTARLADGLAKTPDAFRRRHADYLRSCQNADGGFPGREGGSDLYYTGFALRGLAVLDGLTPEVCDRAADYLRAHLSARASVVDFFSFLYSCLLVQGGGGPDVLADAPADWPERVAAALETFHTPDGGYNKTTGAVSGSTYHTFLVGLCYQLLGRPLPRPDEIDRFVLSRRRDDGGFVEVGAMRRSGTNPTAAAVGLLQLLQPGIDELSEELRQRVIPFLADMAGDDGGLRANGRVPLSDLLSTFTAAWTLEQLGAFDRIDGAALRRFAEATERAEGGFHAGLWDEGFDVEYTFYGLGVLALVSLH